ncbi:MAG: RraA family protein [Rhodospirillales bacterium]|nr:RraA family protein [Rhodospirillales bacterium]
MTPQTDAERSERLHGLYTGAVADILDELEPTPYRNQCLPHAIRPVLPAMKVAGPVFTIRARLRHYNDGVDPRYKQMDMLDAIFPHSIIVIEPGDDDVASHWGELMSNVALKQGATGAVIHGGLRDAAQIIDLGFPVFTKYFTPATAAYRSQITEFGVPLLIGGVKVEPRDFILGDIDGVVVIPGAVVDEVIEKAESVRDREHKVRDLLREGGNIRELFEKYGVF